MQVIFKQQGFEIITSDNGMNALHKVMEFISFHNKMRILLQNPEASHKNFSQQAINQISSELKNYDLIVLDLNMPIMNGYIACQKIIQVYKAFNCLPDYDEQDSDIQQEKKHLDEINVMFQEHALKQEIENIVIKNQFSYNNFQSQQNEKIKFQETQLAQNVGTMIDQVRNFYKFKRNFNSIQKMHPLIVACSADINENVKELSKQVGFDLVIQTPITEQIIINEILPKLQHKQKNYSNLKRQQLKTQNLNQYESQSLKHNLKNDILSEVQQSIREKTQKLKNNQELESFSV